MRLSCKGDEEGAEDFFQFFGLLPAMVWRVRDFRGDLTFVIFSSCVWTPYGVFRWLSASDGAG